MNSIEHFIDGKIIKGSSKKKSKVFNPATGTQSAEVNLASKADVDLAIQKAKKAFENYRKKYGRYILIPTTYCSPPPYYYCEELLR